MSDPKWAPVIVTDDWILYVDATGAYSPEIELFEYGKLYRWSIEKFRLVYSIDGEACIPYLTSGSTDGQYPHNHKEWLDSYIADVAQSIGTPEIVLRLIFTDDNVLSRAQAYLDVAGYLGAENFDQYPASELLSWWDSRCKWMKNKIKAEK